MYNKTKHYFILFILLSIQGLIFFSMSIAMAESYPSVPIKTVLPMVFGIISFSVGFYYRALYIMEGRK